MVLHIKVHAIATNLASDLGKVLESSVARNETAGNYNLEQNDNSRLKGLAYCAH